MNIKSAYIQTESSRASIELGPALELVEDAISSLCYNPNNLSEAELRNGPRYTASGLLRRDGEIISITLSDEDSTDGNERIELSISLSALPQDQWDRYILLKDRAYEPGEYNAQILEEELKGLHDCLTLTLIKHMKTLGLYTEEDECFLLLQRNIITLLCDYKLAGLNRPMRPLHERAPGRNSTGRFYDCE